LSDSVPPAAASEEKEKLGPLLTVPHTAFPRPRQGTSPPAPPYVRAFGLEPGIRFRVPGSTLTGCLDVSIGRNIILKKRRSNWRLNNVRLSFNDDRERIFRPMKIAVTGGAGFIGSH